MSQLTEEQLGEWLSGYLDGEVDARERAFVEHLLREDPRAAPLLAELRGVTAAVAALPRHAAPPSIAGDVRQFTERTELLGPTALAGQAPRSAGWKSRSGVFVAWAAMIGITLGAALWYQGGEGIVGLLKGPATRERALSADARSKETTRERRAEKTSTNLSDADRPIAEETYARFVTEVLALAGSTIEEPGRESSFAEKSAPAAPGHVLALRFNVADRAAGRWREGEMALEIRKLAEISGGTVSESTVQGEVVATAERRGIVEKSRDGSKSDAVQTWSVNVPMSELPRFAEAVLSRTASRSRVTLSVGKTEISGNSAAHEALRRVDQTWRRRKPQPATSPPMTQTQRLLEKESPPPRSLPPATGGVYGGLLQALGVRDLSEWVLPGPKPSSEAMPMSGDETASQTESSDAAKPDGVGDESAPPGALASRSDSPSEEMSLTAPRSNDIGTRGVANQGAALTQAPRPSGGTGDAEAGSLIGNHWDGTPSVRAARTGLVDRRLAELHGATDSTTDRENGSAADLGSEPPFLRAEPWVTVAITVVVDSPERPSPIRPPGARRGNGNDARPAGR